MPTFTIHAEKPPLAFTILIASLIALVLLAGWAAVNPALAQSTGTVTGQVVDETGAPLPGANVVVMDTQIGEATDQNGRYRLSGVPSGEQALTASFVGYNVVDTTVTVRAGETIEMDFRLESSTLQSQELIVEAQRGVLRTNQTKKASPAIVDVLDLQTLERYPDQTLAESLDRLPGVFTQANLGQGVVGTAGRGFKNEFIVVRGIQPDLNNTTVLGQSLVSTTGDRSVALDVLPGNVASQVEVVKALTPDMSANSIGGTTNIVPLSAFSRQGAFLSASAEGAYRQEVGELAVNGQPINVRARGGTQFGPDDEFGIAITTNYRWDAFTTTLFQPDEWRRIDAPDIPGDIQIVEGTRLEQGRSQFQAFGATSNFEWRPSPDRRFGVVTSYANTVDDQLDLQTEWNFSDDSFGVSDDVLFDPIEGVSPRERFYSNIGRNDKESDLDRQEERMFLTIGSSEIRFGAVDWTTRASYVRAEKDEIIREWQFNNSLSDFDGDPSTVPFTPGDPYNFESIVRLDTPEPWGDPVNERMFKDPSVYAFDGLGIDSETVTAETYEAGSDFRYNVSWLGGSDGFFKTGARLRVTTTALEAEGTNIGPNPDNIFTLADFNLAATPGDVEGLTVGPTVDPVRGKEFLENNPDYFQISPDTDASALGDYEVDETVTSGYVMAGNTWGKLSVIGGLRLENTTTEASVKAFNDETEEVTEDTDSNSYLSVLPNLHLRYQFSARLQARAAVTRTLSRANLEQLAGGKDVGYNPGDQIEPGLVRQGSISQGNPALDPFQSLNVDATLEYYPTGSDLYIVNFFYKQIDDPIFPGTAIRQNVEAAGITFQEAQVSQPVNANEGTILGIESQMQQTFRFLPGPLDGLGLAANFSVLRSDLTVPGREDEDLTFFQQPDIITSVGPFFIWRGLDVRLNYSYTDDFVTVYADPEGGVGLGGSSNDRFLDSQSSIDLKVTYNVNPNYMVTFAVENLDGDGGLRIYEELQSQTWLRQAEGRQFWLGIRASF